MSGSAKPGIAWVAPDVGCDDESEHVVVWAPSLANVDESIMEEMPSRAAALAWARARAAVVLIRTNTSEYYSAGAEQPPGEPNMERWPD